MEQVTKYLSDDSINLSKYFEGSIDIFNMIKTENLSFKDFIEFLGPYLTSNDDIKRKKGIFFKFFIKF